MFSTGQKRLFPSLVHQDGREKRLLLKETLLATYQTAALIDSVARGCVRPAKDAENMATVVTQA